MTDTDQCSAGPGTASETDVDGPGGGRMPGPAGRAAVAAMLRASHDRLGLMMALADRYGDAVRFRLGPKVLRFFNHPTHVRQVLVDRHDSFHRGIGLVQARRALGNGLLTSDGESWRRQRAVVRPLFQRDRVAASATSVVTEVAATLERWHRHSGGPLDLAAEMNRLAVGVLNRAVLHAPVTTSSIGDAFDAIQRQAMFEVLTLGTVPHWLPTPRRRRFTRARRHLAGAIDTLLRADAGTPTGDLVAYLLRHHPPTEVRNQLMTLMLAGHETTASTLTWTCHLVGGHREVSERLHHEASGALTDRQPTFDDLHRLPYTTMVVKEAMRLYPPVWLLSRQTVEPVRIGGYDVPTGADVLISPYTLHRHPQFWTRPDRFLPDRFADTGAEDRHRYAYIPFGAGPRHCVGGGLGMMEAVLATAMIAREFRLAPAGTTAPRPDALLSLRVRGRLPMVLHRR